ncbi:hypothetical protein ACW5X7_003899, partial [Morganella morganii]
VILNNLFFILSPELDLPLLIQIAGHSKLKTRADNDTLVMNEIPAHCRDTFHYPGTQRQKCFISESGS